MSFVPLPIMLHQWDVLCCLTLHFCFQFAGTFIVSAEGSASLNQQRSRMRKQEAKPLHVDYY